MMQQQQSTTGRNIGLTSTEDLQEQDQNRGVHSKFREHSWKSLRMLTTTWKDDKHIQMESSQGRKEGFHSKSIEPSWHLLGTLNVGRCRVQAADPVDPQQVPFTGYENFQQDIQAYPVSREPVMVQPTVSNNSAILDLPNVNTHLPPPLMPRQTDQMVADGVDATQQFQWQQEQQLTVTNSVSNSEILESIQSITKVMQQQLLFTAEQGIIQNASLFQEMIKAQEGSGPRIARNSNLFGWNNQQIAMSGLDIQSKEHLWPVGMLLLTRTDQQVWHFGKKFH